MIGGNLSDLCNDNNSVDNEVAIAWGEIPDGKVFVSDVMTETRDYEYVITWHALKHLDTFETFPLMYWNSENTPDNKINAVRELFDFANSLVKNVLLAPETMIETSRVSDVPFRIRGSMDGFKYAIFCQWIDYRFQPPGDVEIQQLINTIYENKYKAEFDKFFPAYRTHVLKVISIYRVKTDPNTGFSKPRYTFENKSIYSNKDNSLIWDPHAENRMGLLFKKPVVISPKTKKIVETRKEPDVVVVTTENTTSSRPTTPTLPSRLEQIELNEKKEAEKKAAAAKKIASDLAEKKAEAQRIAKEKEDKRIAKEEEDKRIAEAQRLAAPRVDGTEKLIYPPRRKTWYNYIYGEGGKKTRKTRKNKKQYQKIRNNTQ